jgi:hypothetical protein
MVMGNKAFDNFLVSIQGQIGMLKDTLKVLNKCVTSLRDRQANGNQVAVELVRTVADVMEKEQTIAVLKDFWAMMKSEWSSPNDRIISNVVWSPPIIGLHCNNPPNSSDGYTMDVCIIELNVNKFINWRGNVIDLGVY